MPWILLLDEEGRKLQILPCNYYIDRIIGKTITIYVILQQNLMLKLVLQKSS